MFFIVFDIALTWLTLVNTILIINLE